MRFKGKWLLALVALLAIGLLVAGCGGKEEPKPADSGDTSEPVTLKLAHQWPVQNAYGLTFQKFADLVDQKSEGSIKIEVYPANSLVTIQEMFEAVLNGTADIGYSGTSFLSARMKELSAMEIPGAYDPYKFPEIVDEIDPIMEEIYAKYGLVYLWAQDGAEAALSSKKPVQTIDDLKGLKVRGYGFWVGKALEQLGAVPVTIPPTDLNVALERGTAEGSYSAYAFSDGFKLYEQTEYNTWFGTQTMWVNLLMNKEAWDKLSPEQQEIMREAGKEAMAYNIQLITEGRDAFDKKARDAGNTVYTISEEEREKIFEKVKPVWEEARTVAGPLGNKLMDKLEELR